MCVDIYTCMYLCICMYMGMHECTYMCMCDKRGEGGRAEATEHVPWIIHVCGSQNTTSMIRCLPSDTVP